MGVEYTDSAFSFLRPAIGHIFLYLFLEGIFFLILAMVIEVGAAKMRLRSSIFYASPSAFALKYVRKFSSSIVQRLRCQGPNQATTGTTNEVEAGIGGEVRTDEKCFFLLTMLCADEACTILWLELSKIGYCLVLNVLLYRKRRNFHWGLIFVGKLPHENLYTRRISNSN